MSDPIYGRKYNSNITSKILVNTGNVLLFILSEVAATSVIVLHINYILNFLDYGKSFKEGAS